MKIARTDMSLSGNPIYTSDRPEIFQVSILNGSQLAKMKKIPYMPRP